MALGRTAWSSMELLSPLDLANGVLTCEGHARQARRTPLVTSRPPEPTGETVSVSATAVSCRWRAAYRAATAQRAAILTGRAAPW